jgi:hypothetical protein
MLSSQRHSGEERISKQDVGAIGRRSETLPSGKKNHCAAIAGAPAGQR